MMNTMADLREEVAVRLRETLHGREIDTLEKGTPEIEHMLGVVTLGAISTERSEKGTLLDPEYEFWKSYYKDLNTRNAIEEEIETAMHSLKEDDVFRVSEPYGENAEILYVEVDDVSVDDTEMSVECENCEAAISTNPSLTRTHRGYKVLFDLNCTECDFNKRVGKNLTRFK